jgi:CheY-like chemotaxis protein
MAKVPVFLLVDDNYADVYFFREALKETGIQVDLHVLHDGRSAMDALLRRGEFPDFPRPDLLLLDWHLPGKSAEEILAELASSVDLKKLPIVVCNVPQKLDR